MDKKDSLKLTKLKIVNQEINYIDKNITKLNNKGYYQKIKPELIISSKQKSVIKYNEGKWNNEENKKFIEALFLFGNKWKKILSYVQTRSMIQLRSHFQKFILKLKSKFKVSNYINEEEDVCFNRILDILANDFNCEFLTNFLINPEDKIPIAYQSIRNCRKIIRKKRKNFLSFILSIIRKGEGEIQEKSEKSVSNISLCDYSNIKKEEVLKEGNEFFNVEEDDFNIEPFNYKLFNFSIGQGLYEYQPFHLLEEEQEDEMENLIFNVNGKILDKI